MTDYNQPCSDSVVITDSRIVTYIKNIIEAGLLPRSTLYPSDTCIPLTSMTLYDECSSLPGKNLSDSFTSVDTIGPNAICKGLQNSVSISDGLMKASVKYLDEGGRVPENSLYPTIDLYPNDGTQIHDVIKFGFSGVLADSFIVSDISSFDVSKHPTESVGVSDYNIKSIGKHLGEIGTLPETTLYPANDFYPEGGMSVTDVINFGFFRSLSDLLNINDVDGINLDIGKGLSEDITIFDVILFNIVSYLEENTNILDEISKSGSKSLDNSFIIEDNVIKNIIQLLSEDITTFDGILNNIVLYLEENTNILDEISKGENKLLSSGFDIEDNVIRNITQLLSEDINIFDDILFNLSLYLEENTNILDEISKGSYKSFDDAFMIEDDIIRNIMQLLSESVIVDANMEIVLRTLVRATLRVMKNRGSSLRVI